MWYRKRKQQCIYCGNKMLKCYHTPERTGKTLYECPSDIVHMDKLLTTDENGQKVLEYTNWNNGKCNTTGCSIKKKFISLKEAKVQRALGLIN